MNGTRVGVCLEPLDVLFFRDGRPFGAATRASSIQPMPQTVAGAIWTALLQAHGCDFNVLVQAARNSKSPEEAIAAAGGPAWVTGVRVRGPWLACLNKQGGVRDVLVPAPAILHQVKGKTTEERDEQLHRLRPRRQKVPGWEESATEQQSGLRPLWLRHRQPTEPATGFLTPNGLQTFLDGGQPGAKDLLKGDELFAMDDRTGIEISADRLSAKEGGIYGASFLALRPAYKVPGPNETKQELPGVGLYAEIILPAEAPAEAFSAISTLALGGEGRRAALKPQPQPYEWPMVKLAGGKQRPLLVLTTPGFFRAGWRPSCLDGRRIVSAAVPTPVAVSGWDLARGGPKPTRFAAPAGSVYFLDSLPDPMPDVLSDKPEDCQQGWGCYVKGAWTDE